MGLAPLAAAKLLEQYRRDPLSDYRCACWAQPEIVRNLSQPQPVECLWLAGNSGAKTTGGISLDLAFCMGRETLMDWDRSEVRLPLIRPPVAWVLGIPSYKIGGASSIAKLRELLGRPDPERYHESRAGGEDQVTTFAIRHRLSRSSADDRSDWSRLYVFPYEGVMPEAMRLDGWHCDEPPPYRFLDALRNRKKQGRPLYGYLTMTPIERRLWGPILAEYPQERKKAVKGRIVFQSSLYDNRALSKTDIAAHEAAVRTSPYRLARLYGDPVDISNTCPFDIDELVSMREHATDGEHYGYGIVQRDGRDAMYPQQHGRGVMESWGWPEADDLAIIVADPSSGIRDPDKPDHLQPRNPSGLVMCSMLQRRMLLRFNGYVRAHELGAMARAVANRCPRWLMVHETNGGWGDAFLKGWRETPALTQGELYFEPDPVTGKLAADPGWRQTNVRRGALLSALQAALEQRALGIPSRAAIDNLLQVRIDDADRWDHGDGKGPHGEDVITLGIAAYVMARTVVQKRRPTMAGRPAFDVRPAVSESAVIERWD